MGVIREPRKILIQTGDSNSEQSSAPATDDESGRSTPAMSAQGATAPGRRNPLLCPNLLARKIGYSLKLKKGRRSKQRFENERLLMMMYGMESEDYQPGQEVCNKPNSYFTDLLDDDNKTILEEFLNNEESKYFSVLEEEEEEENEEEGRDEHSKCTPPTVDELKQEFQAEEAYLRIGSRMRQVFKKSVPLGMLRAIEDDINDAFIKSPCGEFESELSSFERLLVHALSAYNSLNSYSYDRGGKRVVKVENPHKQFYKKDPLLTEYIIKRNNL